MAQLTWYISASPKANNDNTGNENLGSNGNQTPNQESTDKNQNTSMKKTAGQMVALSVAKRSASYLVSNVGKYSGNSKNQTMVNNVSKLVGYGVAFAANPYLGAAVVVMDGITSLVDMIWDKRWEKATADQAKARAGEGVGYRL